MISLFFCHNIAYVNSCGWRKRRIGTAKKSFVAKCCNSFNFDAGFFLSDHTGSVFSFLIVVCHNIITAFAFK